MMTVRIAILMTCHNRRDTTLAGLDALMNQTAIKDLRLQVYLVDDGCTDGTGQAVKQRYPDTRVIEGSGNLFWNGGMRVAFAEAMKDYHDYYLWLNDDTMLFTHAVRTLVETTRVLQKQQGHEVIVAGSTQDSNTHLHNYGGVVRKTWWQPMFFLLVEPSDKPQACDTFNGNCVLIPKEVVEKVGNLSPVFTHGAGDFDYGLRAQSLGINCWICPWYVGTCESHEVEGSHLDLAVSTSERLKRMHSPGGLPPAREWMTFTKRHAGIMWPVYWMRTLMRVCFPRLWLKVRSRRAG